MKKQILKLFFASFVFTILFSCPLVFAVTPTFGVSIQGETSIDAVATIKADVTVNLTDRTVGSTYLYIQNDSGSPIQAKITNIESLTEGAPSTFIDQDENYLTSNYGITDTESKIGFSITNHTANFIEQNILPNQEIDLGILTTSSGMGGTSTNVSVVASSDGDTIPLLDYNGLYSGLYASLFEVTPHVGYAWTQTGQTFDYGITIVFGMTEESVPLDKTWKNAYTDIGVQDVNFDIKKSSSGAYYLVGKIDYDPNVVTDVSDIGLGVTNYPGFNLISSTGKSYLIEMPSVANVLSDVVEFSTTAACKYYIYPIDLSNVSELMLGSTNEYYFGIDAQLMQRVDSSRFEGIGDCGIVRRIWLS